MAQIDKDIRDVSRNIIQGNEARKKRIKHHTESAFDRMAYKAVSDALLLTCTNLENPRVRQEMQKQVYKSIAYTIPYEHMGTVCCGRRQFYEYRNHFIEEVARQLGMLP